MKVFWMDVGKCERLFAANSQKEAALKIDVPVTFIRDHTYVLPSTHHLIEIAMSDPDMVFVKDHRGEHKDVWRKVPSKNI